MTDHELNHPKRTRAAFLKKVLFFFAPLLAIIAFLEGLLWFTGESWPIGRVIAYQQGRAGSLFLRGICDQEFYRYKFLQVQKRKPRVLVLGSSRVMQFRQEMFGERAADFYNAGGMVQGVQDLRWYIDAMTPETTPDTIILGVDLWWFNGHKRPIDALAAGATREAVTEWPAHFNALRGLTTRRLFLSALHAIKAGSPNLGLKAKNAGGGFREDGSLDYNLPAPSPDGKWKFVDGEDPPINQRIKKNQAQFPPCNGYALTNLAAFEACLEKLAAKKIQVLGFLPPFSSESADLLQTSPAHSNLWVQFHAEIPKLFSRHAQVCLDTSTPTALGLDDSCMMDGIHSAETFDLCLVKKLLAVPEAARKFHGLEPQIDAQLKSPKTNPWFPDYSAGAKARPK